MTELQQISKRLNKIEGLLNTLLIQNTPFSLDVHDKATIMRKAMDKANETGDRSYVRRAAKEINGEV